jgi:hypothetical protein
MVYRAWISQNIVHMSSYARLCHALDAHKNQNTSAVLAKHLKLLVSALLWLVTMTYLFTFKHDQGHPPNSCLFLFFKAGRMNKVLERRYEIETS